MSAKFWSKVDVRGPDECWPWLGYRKPSGHGLTTLDSLPIHASRKAWILTHGPITDGSCVNHKSAKVCPLQAPCCNPRHAYLGTRIDNMVDRWTQSDAVDRGQLGRPTALDEAQLVQLWTMYRGGTSMKLCAQTFGVHVSTISRYLAAIRAKKSAKLHSVRMGLPHSTLV